MATKKKVTKSEVRKAWMELFDQYVAEAEHQEGAMYFQQSFRGVEDAIVDILMYVNEVKGMS